LTKSAVHFRVLALAGVFQAAALVKQLAKTGRINDEQAFLANIQSILKVDVENALEVYESPKKLALGLNELICLFSNNKLPKDPDIARYVFSLLHLERKLMRNSKMLTLIQTGLKRATTQATYFSPLHENVMANLSSLYTDTLSTFSFRIHVTGEPRYLSQTLILNKIRALLLAGVRSAVLWRQMGGRRWQLLLTRSTILEIANQWLKEYAAEPVA